MLAIAAPNGDFPANATHPRPFPRSGTPFALPRRERYRRSRQRPLLPAKSLRHSPKEKPDV